MDLREQLYLLRTEIQESADQFRRETERYNHRITEIVDRHNQQIATLRERAEKADAQMQTVVDVLTTLKATFR